MATLNQRQSRSERQQKL